jgi:Response regulator containing CheY-like receiver, AAA-type ATPase, and DNA-binding domains
VRGHDITPGEYAVLVVSDTGHGMEPTTVQRIFEPFYTTKASGSGTGLGLATVDAIVTDAGGFVQVESAAGAGTTFRVLLPIAPPDAVDDQVRLETVASGGSETVLLVEDEEAVRTIATRILASQGYAVLSARHGKDALELAASHDGPIDLLLTDLVMPEMDGYTLAARLRELRPEMRIVFITGYSEPSPRAGSPDRPAELIVHKPFSSEDLAAVTRRALDASS